MTEKRAAKSLQELRKEIEAYINEPQGSLAVLMLDLIHHLEAKERERDWYNGR